MATQEVKHPVSGRVVNFAEAALVRDEAQAVIDNERPMTSGEP